MADEVGSGLLSDQQKRQILLERLLAQRKATLGNNSETARRQATPADGRHSLSSAQERMWFLHEMNPTSSAYTITTAYDLRGRWDPCCLRSALCALAARHEMLRSSFHAEGAQPYRRIHESVLPELRVLELTPTQCEPMEQLLATKIQEETHRLWDITIAPLFRATLLVPWAEKAVLVFTFHHIIADGWSLGVFNRDLGLAYSAALAGREAYLRSTLLSYDEVVQRQAMRLQTAVGQAQLKYWVNRLRDLPALELPMARPRPPVAQFTGRRHEEYLDEALVQRLEAIAKETASSLYMVIAAAFAALLYRYSGQAEIVFGSPVAGRTEPDTEDLIGLFVNTVVLRIDLAGGPSFKETVARVRDISLKALEHQNIPFEQVVERLAPQRALSHNPLFQVMFALQNFKVEEPDLAGLVVNSLAPPETNVRFDLECTVWRRKTGALVRFVYNTDIIDETTAVRMSAHFIGLLRVFGGDPCISINDAPLLTAEERQVIENLERGAELHGQAFCLHGALEKIARERPASPAVEDGSITWTFDQLNLKANQIAHALQKEKAGVGEIVAVCLPRTVDFVAAILGVVKAGCAFLPLNPADPKERLRFILRDAHVRLAVSSQESLPQIEDAEWVDINEVYAQLPSISPQVTVQSSDLAYVIYTSGTTGRPKGVLVEHRNLMSTLHACQHNYQFSSDDRGLVLASNTFDVFYYELFAPILAGGCSRLVSKTELFDPVSLASLVYEATCFQAVPGLMEQVLAALSDQHIDCCPRMRVAMTGGDLVPPALLNTLRRVFPRAVVSVTYGPTETTIFCTGYCVANEDVVRGHPIGTPLPGTVVRIGDDRGMPLPLGVDGEIWISGQGVSRGYFHRPEENSQKFITIDGRRFYRSGDRARRTLEGIEFLGRADSQVKVRGFRIELGEVEAVLSEAPGVARAVAVAAGENPSGRLLAAYIVLDDAALPQSVDDAPLNIERWQTLFDNVYDSSVRHVSGENDFIGWNSSYTGCPIPIEQMEDWLAGTLAQLRSRVPPSLLEKQRLRVLEIGCGTGLVLLHIAPQCAHYTASDLSARAIADLYDKVERKNLSHVDLYHTTGESLGDVGSDFDVVVINSVVQYFPDERYLRRVLQEALTRTRQGGFVFVGDVRSLPLLPTFRVAVDAANSPSRPAAEVLARAGQRASDEEELTVHPMFFRRLAEETDLISRVEAEPRRGRYSNEMTRYRYDVFLHRGLREAPTQIDWHPWAQEAWNLEKLQHRLTQGKPETLALQEIPNALIDTDIKLHTELARVANRPGPTIPDGAPVSPDELRALAESTGYQINLSCLRGAANGTYDAYFQRESVSRNAPPAWPMMEENSETSLVGSPLRRTANQRVLKAIRDFLACRLPEYMMPSALMIVDSLPLTSNGKVDRTALPSISHVYSEASRPPGTQGERLIAQVWTSVLGSEPSTSDDFFECGGTSLLALQVAVGLRAQGVRFAPQQVFELRTVEKIGELLDKQFQGRALMQNFAAAAKPAAPGRPSTSPRPPVPALQGAIDCWQQAEGILLSGATGMLGAHLLQEILLRYRCHVFCLVRGEDDAIATARLREQFCWYFPNTDLHAFDKRVTAVAADLRRASAGLSAAHWNSLAGQIQHVIHAAADVRHVAETDELLATNLNGTRHLLHLAGIRRDIHFCYISTIGIKGIVSEEKKDAVLTEHDFDIGQRTTEAYSESKMQAERAVRAFLQQGGQGAIFRVGTVAAHSHTGRFQRNIDAHFFSRYLRSILEIGAIGNWPDRQFALLSADVLAQAILALSGRTESLGQTFHLENPHRISPPELAAILCTIGYPIRLMSPEAFAQVVMELGHDPRHALTVSRLMPLLERKPGRDVRLDASWTLEWLEQLGIRFAPCQESWFARFIKHGIGRRYFPPPPTAEKDYQAKSKG
ncbi:MAG TPA: amino acid adenylation domain-containing protein [Candidatus Angelobacter sp.]|jgi:amino acid adenylation domain-containing protein/thioester reductase-like protein|nr:amino acid adenylation domain-containing protein [Candidatus Angelobacter sp.]